MAWGAVPGLPEGPDLIADFNGEFRGCCALGPQKAIVETGAGALLGGCGPVLLGVLTPDAAVPFMFVVAEVDEAVEESTLAGAALPPRPLGDAVEEEGLVAEVCCVRFIVLF